MTHGTCKEANCAAHVVTTVVSLPTSERAVIDAGSKVLTSDLLGLQGYGQIVGYPNVEITGLSEEHGTLSVTPDSGLKIDERIQIIPNHVCVVANMFDAVWLIDKSNLITAVRIDARGQVC